MKPIKHKTLAIALVLAVVLIVLPASGPYALATYGGGGSEPGHTVSYDANGGEGTVPVDTKGYGYREEVTVLGRGGLEMEGRTFVGWERTDNVGLLREGDSFEMPAYHVTLVAQWLENDGNSGRE